MENIESNDDLSASASPEIDTEETQTEIEETQNVKEETIDAEIEDEEDPKLEMD